MFDKILYFMGFNDDEANKPEKTDRLIFTCLVAGAAIVIHKALNN